MEVCLSLKADLSIQYNTQKAKITKKVHNPPLGINVINFESKGFNASIRVPWSPSPPVDLNWFFEIFIRTEKKNSVRMNIQFKLRTEEKFQ